MKPTALVLAVLFALTGIASAATINVVDQSQTSITTFLTASAGTTTAQGFVPTLSGLDAVILQLATFSGQSPSLSINIRSLTPGGTILATSNTVQVPQSADPALFQFDFASTVALTAGNLYYIEFTSPGLFVLGSQTNPYAAGEFYRDGSNPTQDAYFVEGLYNELASVPEPDTLGLVAFSIAGCALLLQRTTRA